MLGLSYWYLRNREVPNRLCVDYLCAWALNRKRIDDKIDLLSVNRHFISLNMTSGYYQIPVMQQCKCLTAFITRDGLFQFRRASSGLANCMAVFERPVNIMLGKSKEKGAVSSIHG